MTGRALIIAAIALPLAACGDQSMTQQYRYRTYGEASSFKDAHEAQPLPKGVVAQGDGGRQRQTSEPPPVDAALMSRGRDRFDIYCSPCHGLAGRGDGIVVQRGFPTPPSFHTAQMRQATAQHIFDTITHGHGVMYGFADRIEPRDRWAIVAYVRALQQSQDTKIADAPDLRSRLP